MLGWLPTICQQKTVEGTHRTGNTRCWDPPHLIRSLQNDNWRAIKITIIIINNWRPIEWALSPASCVASALRTIRDQRTTFTFPENGWRGENSKNKNALKNTLVAGCGPMPLTISLPTAFFISPNQRLQIVLKAKG